MTIHTFAQVVGSTIAFNAGDVFLFDTLDLAGNLSIMTDDTDTLLELGGQVLRLSLTSPGQLSSANFSFPGGGIVLVSGPTPQQDGHTLTGTGFSDMIFLNGAGADQVSAGAGNDRIVLGKTSSLDALDHIDGGSGFDRLDLQTSINWTLGATSLTGVERVVASADAAVTLKLVNATVTSAIGFTLDTTAQVQGVTTQLDASAVTSLGIAALTGSGNDTLLGGGGGDVLSSGDGADSIKGGAGNDTITGGLGADTLTGDAGNDVFAFGPGIPRSDSSPLSPDIITDFQGLGATGGDQINFDQVNFPAYLTFNTTNTPIPGFTIAAGLSVPALAGDGLIDVVWAHDVAAHETRIWVDVDDDGQISEEDILIRLTNVTATQVTAEDFSQAFIAVKLTNGDDAYPGSTFNNTGPNMVFALEGNDTVDGGIGSDTLYGASGADRLTGGADADQLHGGSEADTLYGGDGSDTLMGGTGVDQLYGGNGSDTLIADGDGADGPDTTNVLYGGAGDDRITGAEGADLLDGGTDNDVLYAGDGADTLFASDGDDVASGGLGNDVLAGGAGNDTIWGDAGADTVTGGSGADVFSFSPYSPEVDSSVQRIDEITDFNRAEGDLFDLGTAYTFLGSFGDAPIVFAGNLAGFTGTAGDTVPDYLGIGASITQLYYAYLGAGNAMLLADLNHNGAYDSSDFVIHLTGGSVPGSLTEADFVPNSFQAIVGTANDDLINSVYTPTHHTTNGDDLVFAVAGNDTVLAMDGADRVYGGDGNDSVDGGLGSDMLDGGAGNDSVDGGFGNDTVYGGDGNDAVTGGDGADTLQGGAGSDTIHGGADGDLIFAGSDDATTGNQLYGEDGGDQIYGGEGNDLIDGGIDDDYLRGGGGADAIDGGTGADNLDGGSGDDSLTGDAGTDVLSGDAGADSLTGGSEADTFSYSPYDPALDSSLTAMDTITDFNAAEGDRIDLGSEYTFEGNFGSAPIAWGGALAAASTIWSNLTLPARPAGLTWTYSVQIGADTYLVADLDGDRQVTDVDFVVKLAGLNRGLSQNDFVPGTFQVIVGTDNDDLITDATPPSATTGGADTVYALDGNDTVLAMDGADRVYGGAGNDSVDGGFGNDTVYGGDGNDAVTGGDGADTLQGGTGSDTIHGGADGDLIFAGSDDATTGNQLYGEDGGDQIYGGEGNDLIDGGIDDDYLRGGGGADAIDGGTGADNLDGGSGDDSLTGDAGTDVLSGDAGADSLTGGSEADTFSYSPYDPASESSLTAMDTITDFNAAEGDRIDLGTEYTFMGDFGGAPIRWEGSLGTMPSISLGMALPDASTSGTEVTRLFIAKSGTDTYVIADLDGDGFLGTDDFVLRVRGTADLTEAGFVDGTFGVQIGTGQSQDSTQFHMTLGDDRVMGLGGDDVILALDGADRVYGGAGNDSLDGGAGSDTVNGDAGNDVISGGDGSDSLYGDAGADTIHGGNDADLIYGGSDDPATGNALYGDFGADQIRGGEGNDLIDGGLDDDYFYGAGGGDTLLGQSGADMLDGGDGADQLYGGALEDTLYGGSGNDMLQGDAGNDEIYAGEGSDRVVYDVNDTVVDGGTDPDASDQDILVLTSYIQVDLANLADQVVGGGIATGFEGVDFSALAAGVNFTGNGLDNTIIGTVASDTLGGGAGNDTIDGGAGNDILRLSGLRADYTFFGDRALFLAQHVAAGTEVDLARNFERVAFDDGTFTVVALGLPVDAPPTVTAPADLGQSNEDTPFLITKAALLAGASDWEGAALNVVGLSASSGSLVNNGNGTWTFQPAANDFSGVTFSYQVSDGTNLVGQTAHLDLLPVNDAAVGGTDDVTTGRNVALTITAALLLANDTDVDNPHADLTIGAVHSVSGGVAGLNPDGSVTFTPDAGFTGVATFTYQPFDGTDLGLATLVRVTVTGTVPGIVLNGTAGPDTLTGGEGNDTITGNAGNDLLVGNGGNDIITGGAGNDTLMGGEGDDRFSYGTGSNGFDAVDGGAGTHDRIQASANGVTIGIASLIGIEEISNGGFTGTILAGSTAANVIDLSLISLSGITLIDGGSGDDVIIGSGLADTILGNAGNDALTGGDGNDTFRYTSNKSGFDAVDGGAGAGDLILALADGTVIGLSSLTGVETISAGGKANVTIVGSTASDVLDFSGTVLTGIVSVDAGAGNDTVTGSLGADVILTGAGNDLLQGGGGNDVFLLGASPGTDVFDGGEGQDSIRASAINQTLTVTATNLVSIETLDAGGFAGFKLLGTAAGDTLDFSAIVLTGVASIDAGTGNDTVTGSAGADVILTGAGNDLLQGGGGDDVFLVGASPGTDVFDGGAGLDTIRATAINQTLSLTGTNLLGIETLEGGGFAGFKLVGRTVADTLNLSAVTLTGVDRIVGGNGNDTIVGSAAGDVIEGSAGADSLTGGSGADTFDFNAVTESKGTTIDRITDFVHGVDRIDLSTIDADGAAGVRDSFLFIGTAAFSGVAGQLGYDTTTIAGTTRVLADTNGDRVVDMEIRLTGKLVLDAADFLL